MTDHGAIYFQCDYTMLPMRQQTCYMRNIDGMQREIQNPTRQLELHRNGKERSSTEFGLLWVCVSGCMFASGGSCRSFVSCVVQ